MKNRIFYSTVLALLAFSATLAGPAQADRFDRALHWRGEPQHIQVHDRRDWHRGHWRNGRHAGRMGWWWGVGGLWYFYPSPVYPYPDLYIPPVVVESPPVVVAPSASLNSGPLPETWYYCEPAKGYYPYVPNCPGGWTRVPATPPDAR